MKRNSWAQGLRWEELRQRGLSVSEIARKDGVSESSVKKRFAAIRKARANPTLIPAEDEGKPSRIRSTKEATYRDGSPMPQLRGDRNRTWVYEGFGESHIIPDHEWYGPNGTGTILREQHGEEPRIVDPPEGWDPEPKRVPLGEWLRQRLGDDIDEVAWLEYVLEHLDDGTIVGLTDDQYAELSKWKAMLEHYPEMTVQELWDLANDIEDDVETAS